MDKRIYEPKEFPLNELDGKCGVYQIKNKVNGKVYIGSSKHLGHRMKEHFRDLKYKKHPNIHLQRAYNKYGRKNIIFEVIEFCSVIDQLNIEQYWINSFLGESCYNMNPFASKPPSPKGRKVVISEERKQRLRETAKKNFENPEFLEKFRSWMKDAPSGKAKEVVCIETGIVYASRAEAQRKTGISSEGISDCCLGKKLTAGNFHWINKSSYDLLSEEEVRQILLSQRRARKVVCLETRKRYESIRDAAKDKGLSPSGIRSCCINKKNEEGRFHWAYFEDYIKMSENEIQSILKAHHKVKRRCRCLETGEIFYSQAEAAKIMGIQPIHVSLSCRGKGHRNDTYHFEYVD